MGDVNVTFEELKHTCALVRRAIILWGLVRPRSACCQFTSRSLRSGKRGRLLMAPIFDMANHKSPCPFSVHSYAYKQSSVLHFSTNDGVEPGDEVIRFLQISYFEWKDKFANVPNRSAISMGTTFVTTISFFITDFFLKGLIHHSCCKLITTFSRMRRSLSCPLSFKVDYA